MSKFHVVLISETGYHVIGSYKKISEALHHILNRKTIGCYVMRDGSTGKRYSVREGEQMGGNHGR